LSKNNNRIESLDSLRGLASFSVVIHHSMLIFPVFYLAHNHEVNNSFVNLLTNTPLHTVWAGHEAVLLFFILSGFVLSLPFFNNRYTNYPQYLIKRFCRIYIPYISAVVISAVLFILIDTEKINNMSELFYGMWSHEISIISVISHVLMLGYDALNLNGVTWSLVHEMRISIVFPFIMFFILRWNWKIIIKMGIISTLTPWAFLTVLSKFIENDITKYLLISIGDTFYYSLFFIFGATLAKISPTVIKKTKALKVKTKALLFASFLLLYNFEWIFFGFGSLKYIDSTIISQLVAIIIDMVIAISILLLFTLTISLQKFDKLLNNIILLKLGKISYSLYLTHIIVLLSMVYLLSNVPTVLLASLVPVASVLLAIPFYLYVEKPSMQLGKYLTKNKSLLKEPKKALKKGA